MPQPQLRGVIRFGVFELEPQTGILRKHGVRIRLQDQPFRVLLALLEKPGDVVTREELQQNVWAGATFGDFDHSLNIAVNKIREALGDSAEIPRFVETLPRRGYRFIAPVESPPGPERVPPPGLPEQPARRQRWWMWVAAAAAVLLFVAGLGMWLLRPAASPELELHRLTNDGSFKDPPVLSDGSRLYFRTGAGPDFYIVQIPLSGGEPARLPIALPGPSFDLVDITPDGQELLLAISTPGVFYTDRPFWVVRIADGSSRRLGTLTGRAARYSPDGRRIAFSAGGVTSPGILSLASSDGSNQRQLLELKGLEIVDPCWSPDGRRIAFGQRKRASQESSAWEIMADGTGLRRLFPDWHRNHLPGGWTPDGRLFLLISQFQFWAAHLPWQWFSAGQSPAFQLSPGEPRFYGHIQLRNNQIFYAVGTTPLGELERLDARSETWVPHLGGISADAVEYSRDGQRVAYATHPDGELAVRLADGSRPVQLTKPPMVAWLPRFSPDGRFIAFMGRSAVEEPWRIYIVDATGGTPRLACPRNSGAEGDLTWAPDGKSIVYALPVSLYYSGEEFCLRVLNLATCEVSKFPGSEGLFSPRWSPDGSTLAAIASAMRSDGRPLMLYHVSAGKWEKVMPRGSVDWPYWSHDGRSLWYYDAKTMAIIRYDTRTRRHEEVIPLKVEDMTGMIVSWIGLAPNDEPMILRRRDVQQIYALEWKAR